MPGSNNTQPNSKYHENGIDFVKGVIFGRKLNLTEIQYEILYGLKNNFYVVYLHTRSKSSNPVA